MDSTETGKSFIQFVETIRRLRSPGGCPWDLAQTHQSLVPFAIEETYELVEAIQSSNVSSLKEELGDVLLQVVLHSIIAEQNGTFKIADVVNAINEKMIYRHPHVFKKNEAEHSQVKDAEGAINHFLDQKEKLKKSDKTDFGIPTALPALQKANKIGEKSKRVQFDWSTAKQVLVKVQEELKELQVEIEGKTPIAQIDEELGDVLFTLAQLGRHLEIDPEQSLQKANKKFEKRFFKMLELGKIKQDEFKNLTADQKESLWEKAKLALKN
jgi:tetrapyrrole methylase family protein/MazG family protein